MPELIQTGKDLGMDFRALDVVHISEDTQNPPPKDKGRVSMPASQGPTRNDADIIGETLATVCKVRNRALGLFGFGNVKANG